MATTVILIVLMGFSPSGASGADMEVKEYVQPSLEVCQAEAAKINNLSERRYQTFNLGAFCTTISTGN